MAKQLNLRLLGLGLRPQILGGFAARMKLGAPALGTLEYAFLSIDLIIHNGGMQWIHSLVTCSICDCYLMVS